MNDAFADYELGLADARLSLDKNRAVKHILSATVRPELIELFLLHYCALGVGMTAPVEQWMRRAGQRCLELGFPELGSNLIAHAKEEAGHSDLMLADIKAVVEIWNRRRYSKLEAERFMSLPPSPGVRLYRELHEKIIDGGVP